MYPPENARPLHGAKPGDRIMHKLVPGFVMTVLKTAPCETDAARPEAHDQYQVLDPDSNPDWLCAYDVVNARPDPENEEAVLQLRRRLGGR
jgi:hypothetical protein